MWEIDNLDRNSAHRTSHNYRAAYFYKPRTSVPCLLFTSIGASGWSVFDATNVVARDVDGHIAPRPPTCVGWNTEQLY